MGVGKSTTGEALAAALSWEHADSDRDIEALFGKSGAEIAAEHGVPRLHQIEAAVLLGALARSTPCVVTAAASTVEDDLVRAALAQRATVVRLVAPPDEVLKRQLDGGHRRPMSRSEFARLAARREKFFAAVEDLRLDATGSTDGLVSAILRSVAGTLRPTDNASTKRPPAPGDTA